MKETVTMLYLGYRDDGKNLSQALREVDPLRNDGERLEENRTEEKWYVCKRNKSVLPYGQPGSLWTVEAERGLTRPDGLQIYVNTFKPAGRWQNDEQVAQWQTASIATRRAFETRQEDKRKAGERLDLAALAPFRQAYWEATNIQRPFVLADIISYITRGVNTRGEGGKD